MIYVRQLVYPPHLRKNTTILLKLAPFPDPSKKNIHQGAHSSRVNIISPYLVSCGNPDYMQIIPDMTQKSVAQTINHGFTIYMVYFIGPHGLTFYHIMLTCHLSLSLSLHLPLQELMSCETLFSWVLIISVSRHLHDPYCRFVVLWSPRPSLCHRCFRFPEASTDRKDDTARSLGR